MSTNKKTSKKTGPAAKRSNAAKLAWETRRKNAKKGKKK